MSPVLGIIASSNQQGRGGGPTSAFDALASITVPSGGLASITFAGIPTGYQHLQIRWNAQTNRGTYGFDDLLVRFNGDASALYSYHYFAGNGSGVIASGASSDTAMNIINSAGTTTSGSWWGAAVADVLDYANLTKFKTMRVANGVELNGNAIGTLNGRVNIQSGTYQSLNAVTSITITSNSSSTFQANSSFALYGVK